MTTTKLSYLLTFGIILVLFYIFFTGQTKVNRVIAETMTDNKTPFECRISLADKQGLKAGVWIHFTISNTSDQDLELLSWYTPFEGFMAELFVIKDAQGEALVYQGPKVKRLTPQPSDFLSIPAHSELDTELDLTLVYPLTTGKYTISLAPRRLEYKTRAQDTDLLPFYCPAQELILDMN
ncbi:hypothetical protein SG34_007715 [Thalassomonas viridans]|uniref:Protease n=1 Tax=Thalassomonas viridans TaxID=137584 RepID=A0AAF0CBP1_9GAMM|nr:hypothetical protein [Thalassomonas viridans]WDE06779.1 hypothetical protein SG34_007715 [Thalassomonas viridans]